MRIGAVSEVALVFNHPLDPAFVPIAFAGEIFHFQSSEFFGNIFQSFTVNIVTEYGSDNLSFCLADYDFTVSHLVAIRESSVFHFLLHLLCSGIFSVRLRPPIRWKQMLVCEGTVICCTIS